MKSHFLIWLGWLMIAFLPGLSAQENLKIKDQNGNVLLEARPEGVVVRKITTADRNLIAGLTAADNGLLVYDTDTKSLWVWQDDAWKEIDGIDLVDDADHDPTNELQDWLTLPGIPACFADGTDDVDDADHDPTNELQTWTTLPGIPAGFADGTDDVDDADHDPTNELQTWATLPDIPADFSDGIDNVDDADADPSNELNTGLNHNGTQLEITDQGGTLTADLGWAIGQSKVFNTSDDVGIGTDMPEAGLHVKGNKGIGEHIMLIENTNAEGSGLNIKIDGSHPLFVSEEGADGFFITHPVSGLDSVFDPVVDNIKNYLLSGNAFDLSQISFSDIASPGGLFDQLGLVDLVSGGVCKGVSNLVDLVNTISQQGITLPNLQLPNDDLPDIPFLPTIPTLPSSFPVNPPGFTITILGNDYTINPPTFYVPTGFISTPINNYNSLVAPVNTGITSVNTSLETAHDNITGALNVLNGLSIPLPEWQMPPTIGPITCPVPNPWDAVSFQFESLNPADYDIVNPLSSNNAFITFSDQFDNKLGAITAQGMGEFAQDYFSKEKVLEIASYVVGVISDDGSLVKNLMKLGKEAIAFYKATDKMGVLYSSGHGDYAEWLERENREEQIGYGDIVGIRAGKISLSLKDAEQVMVVSQAPIVLGNTPEEGKERDGNNVAFIGQVPVKVMGPVTAGDYIIGNPSTPGFGIAIAPDAITPDQMALAVGKSWETNAAPGFKYINTIVGMHSNGWAMPVMKMKAQLDAQQASIESLTERLDKLENNGLMAEAKKPRH